MIKDNLKELIEINKEYNENIKYTKSLETQLFVLKKQNEENKKKIDEQGNEIKKYINILQQKENEIKK